MPRTRPCDYCKRIRRKCQRNVGDTACVRCSNLNLECIFTTRPIDEKLYDGTLSQESTTIDDTVTDVILDSELEDLCRYVKTLEDDMKQLQLNLDQQRQRNATLKQNFRPDAALLPREWNLTFVKGQLRLETGIKSLSDLLRYRQLQIEQSLPIRYLSPVNNTAIKFAMQEDTMIYKLAYILTQYDYFSQSPHTSKNSNNYSPWSHYHQNHPISSTQNAFTMCSPSSYTNITIHQPLSPNFCDGTSSNAHFDDILSGIASYCPELLVDLLVQQYFQCYNSVIPMVHQPTFMAQYLKMTPSVNMDVYNTLGQQSSTSASTSLWPSPLSSSSTTAGSTPQHDPVTLAICCFMSLSYCKHLTFTSHQKREYGEYYYMACRQQIDDLYDDPSPHRQLDVLVSINFLCKFTTMTLRLGDTRKLVSLGYLISVELMKYAAQTNCLFTEVEKEILSRNALVIGFSFFMAEYICDKRMDTITPGKVELKTLPGESEMTVSMLELYTQMCNLIFHYDCRMVVEEIRQAVIGQVGQVTFEAIIRFEQKCLDWWKSLPMKWRYCGHPFDSSAKSAIEHCEYEQALMAHSFLLVLILGVHTTLIYPQNSQGQFADMIQKRAVMITLDCSELLIALTLRMKTITQYCGYTCDCFLHVFDALQNLWKHTERTGDKTMIPMITKHIGSMMHDVNDMIPMDNRPPGLLTISKASHTGQPLAQDCFGGGIDPSAYTRYPLPAQAILFDIINSTAKNIGGTLC